MNYHNTYIKLISKAQRRECLETYFEEHHIIPRALGGSDDISNLVKLTAREHFIAHMLLAKIYGGPMITAAFLMTYQNARKYNGREYAWLREEYSRLQSDRMTGRKLSTETKEKIALAHRGSKRSEASKAKMSSAQLGNTKAKGRIVSDETKQKTKITRKERAADISKSISKSKMGDKNPQFGKERSADVKQKIAASLTGRKRSEETKQKIRDTKRRKAEENKSDHKG